MRQFHIQKHIFKQIICNTCDQNCHVTKVVTKWAGHELSALIAYMTGTKFSH